MSLALLPAAPGAWGHSEPFNLSEIRLPQVENRANNSCPFVLSRAIMAILEAQKQLFSLFSPREGGIVDSSDELHVEWKNTMLITVHVFACGVLPLRLFLQTHDRTSGRPNAGYTTMVWVPEARTSEASSHLMLAIMDESKECSGEEQRPGEE